MNVCILGGDVKRRVSARRLKNSAKITLERLVRACLRAVRKTRQKYHERVVVYLAIILSEMLNLSNNLMISGWLYFKDFGSWL